jgi:hypothetical protein
LIVTKIAAIQVVVILASRRANPDVTVVTTIINNDLCVLYNAPMHPLIARRALLGIGEGCWIPHDVMRVPAMVFRVITMEAVVNVPQATRALNVSTVTRPLATHTGLRTPQGSAPVRSTMAVQAATLVPPTIIHTPPAPTASPAQHVMDKASATQVDNVRAILALTQRQIVALVRQTTTIILVVCLVLPQSRAVVMDLVRVLEHVSVIPVSLVLRAISVSVDIMGRNVCLVQVVRIIHVTPKTGMVCVWMESPITVLVYARWVVPISIVLVQFLTSSVPRLS